MCIIYIYNIMSKYDYIFKHLLFLHLSMKACFYFVINKKKLGQNPQLGKLCYKVLKKVWHIIYISIYLYIKWWTWDKQCKEEEFHKSSTENSIKAIMEPSQLSIFPFLIILFQIFTKILNLFTKYSKIHPTFHRWFEIFAINNSIF